MLLRQFLRKSLVPCRPLTMRSHVFQSTQANQTFVPGTRYPKSPLESHTFNETKSHLYAQNENLFMYKIVSRTDSTFKDSCTTSSSEITDDASFTNYLNKDWRNSSATDICQAFSAVKQFCIQNDINISDPRFDKLVDGLVDHCEKLTDGQLYDLINNLSYYPKCLWFNAHNHHDVWSCLDDICIWKMHNWDIDTMFAFGDLWFKYRLGKLGDFLFILLDKLVKKAGTLTKDQLVHVFFYFNVCRKKSIDFEYEHALQFKIWEMNIDELAVVALGYFKTSSKIKVAPVVRAMISGVTQSAMGIHEMSLSAIMKALRLSCPVRFVDEVNEMLDALLPELDRFSELACLHVALVATGIQTFHPAVLRKCSQRLVENISGLRLKDVERALNVLTMFTFDPKTSPDIFELAFQEIHKDTRIPEIVTYPKCLPAALHYFTLKNKYSYELISRVLDLEFIHSTYGKAVKLLPYQLFSLDSCVEIECPDYKGNRLPASVRYKAARWLTEWPANTHPQGKKMSAKDLIFLGLMDILKNIVKSEDLLTVQHVLPHFPLADIIICKDLNSQTFVNPQLQLSGYQLGDVMRVNSDNESKKWYSVVLLSWNNVIRQTTIPLGNSQMKLRQLEKIGYMPVTIVGPEFGLLSPKEKESYILSKLV